MIRRAFTLRLKPDSLAEYKYHHDNIWPELVAEIERSGIARITTFQRGLILFLVSEIEDEAAWDRLWSSEVHKRWAEIMEPLVHLRDDGVVDAGELIEIFHLTTGECPAPVEVLAVAQVEISQKEPPATDFPPGESNGDINYVLGEATDEELSEDMNVDQLAAEIINDPLAELIAETATGPAPEPSTQPTTRRVTRRAGRKPAAKKTSTKKATKKSAKRRAARAATSKTKKKKAVKKSAGKKPAPKTVIRKTAKKKARKRGRK